MFLWSIWAGLLKTLANEFISDHNFLLVVVVTLHTRAWTV